MTRAGARPVTAGVPLAAAAAVLTGCGVGAQHPAALPTPPTGVHVGAAGDPDAEPARALPPAAAATARAYVVTLNTHDARPGGDTGLHEANRRTRPWVTDAVYRQVADPPTHSAGRVWARLSAAAATTTVAVTGVHAVLRTGDPHPDTGVEVTYTVTTRGRGRAERADAWQDLGLARQPDGRWLVGWLYPG